MVCSSHIRHRNLEVGSRRLGLGGVGRMQGHRRLTVVQVRVSGRLGVDSGEGCGAVEARIRAHRGQRRRRSPRSLLCKYLGRVSGLPLT